MDPDAEELVPRPHMNILQGTLDVLVLKAIAHEARHGYGVARGFYPNQSWGAAEADRC